MFVGIYRGIHQIHSSASSLPEFVSLPLVSGSSRFELAEGPHAKEMKEPRPRKTRREGPKNIAGVASMSIPSRDPTLSLDNLQKSNEKDWLFKERWLQRMGNRLLELRPYLGPQLPSGFRPPFFRFVGKGSRNSSKQQIAFLFPWPLGGVMTSGEQAGPSNTLA